LPKRNQLQKKAIEDIKQKETNKNIMSLIIVLLIAFYIFKKIKNRKTEIEEIIIEKEEKKQIEKVKKSEKIEEKIELQKQKIKEEKNLELCIFTDVNIDKIYLNNIKIIYNFAFIKINKEIQDKIRKELLKLDVPIAVKNLLDRLTNTKADRLKYIPYLWNLVFNNLECMDFTKKITMASIINPKGLK